MKDTHPFKVFKVEVLSSGESMEEFIEAFSNFPKAKQYAKHTLKQTKHVVIYNFNTNKETPLLEIKLLPKENI